jgi:hypothetical protein
MKKGALKWFRNFFIYNIGVIRHDLDKNYVRNSKAMK